MGGCWWSGSWRETVRVRDRYVTGCRMAHWTAVAAVGCYCCVRVHVCGCDCVATSGGCCCVASYCCCCCLHECCDVARADGGERGAESWLLTHRCAGRMSRPQAESETIHHRQSRTIKMLATRRVSRQTRKSAQTAAWLWDCGTRRAEPDNATRSSHTRTVLSATRGKAGRTSVNTADSAG